MTALGQHRRPAASEPFRRFLRADKKLRDDKDDFEQRFSYIKRKNAMAFLHGQRDNGEMIYGLDVTFAAWQTVGRHSWLKLLQLPVIRFIADLGYRLFAKYRRQITRIFCQSSCKIK